ncbi:hypothetical protein [Streptomyces sp. NPDC004589]|uniref:hypothetical protein n=1 Tax=unclassified Streptomyces TaxID=2593676 RepID=UPI0033BB6E6E
MSRAPPASSGGRGSVRGPGTARCERVPSRCTTIRGAGCRRAPRVQDNESVEVTSGHDHPVTEVDLGIKGRFGRQHVQNRG